MSKSHELAWCAGFFDGDGYIHINKVTVKPRNENQTSYIQHRLRIGINHVAIEPLIKVSKILGGEVRLDKSSIKKQYDKYNRKPRHIWFLNDSAAKEALIKLMPYLINKTKVAELAIDFRNTYTKLGGGKIEESTLELRDSYKEQITHLNSLD